MSATVERRGRSSEFHLKNTFFFSLSLLPFRGPQMKVSCLDSLVSFSVYKKQLL